VKDIKTCIINTKKWKTTFGQQLAV